MVTMPKLVIMKVMVSRMLMAIPVIMIQDDKNDQMRNVDANCHGAGDVQFK